MITETDLKRYKMYTRKYARKRLHTLKEIAKATGGVSRQAVYLSVWKVEREKQQT
mgnify:CR=1 FL=1